MNYYKPLATIRHKIIAGILGASRVLHKVTGGKRPKFLFSANVDLTPVGSSLKIIRKTEDEVYIAKTDKSGKIDNSDFKIMTATDLHLGSPGAELNNKTIDRLVRQLRDEKPDLLIITGDCILSDCQHIDSVQFAYMMEKLGVFWAYCFGNHETREEKGFYKYQLLKGMQYYSHCLTLFGKEELFGFGNTAIHIMNEDNTYYKSLYLIDSGRDMIEEYNISHNVPKELWSDTYDFVKQGQIDWYTGNMQKTLKVSPENKSLCYMHIPVKEYELICDNFGEYDYRDSGRTKLLYGTQYESVGSSYYNSGFFTAGKDKAALQAIFSGHDHINDLCAIYEGIYLVYSQCTGYNTYNMTEKLNFKEADCHYGVTLTTLHNDGTITIEPKKHNRYL